MKYLAVLFIGIVLSCNYHWDASKKLDYLPLWHIEIDSIYYQQCERMPTKPNDVRYEQRFLIHKQDKSFIFHGKIFFLEVDSVAYCPNMETYFKICLPNVNSQVEHIFWMKALVDIDGNINQWGLYSDRNKTDEKYLIPLNKAILAMPRWIPAKKYGKSVNSLVTFSVRF